MRTRLLSCNTFDYPFCLTTEHSWSVAPGFLNQKAPPPPFIYSVIIIESRGWNINRDKRKIFSKIMGFETMGFEFLVADTFDTGTLKNIKFRIACLFKIFRSLWFPAYFWGFWGFGRLRVWTAFRYSNYAFTLLISEPRAGFHEYFCPDQFISKSPYTRRVLGFVSRTHSKLIYRF